MFILCSGLKVAVMTLIYYKMYQVSEERMPVIVCYIYLRENINNHQTNFSVFRFDENNI